MIEIKPYEVPAVLQNASVDEIYNRMVLVDAGNGKTAKDVIDVSQGSMFWDACRPTAIEKSMLVQYVLNEIVKSSFVQYASGDDLDNHGELLKVTRKEAVKATTTLTATGVNDTVIPAGTKFTTATIGATAGVEFESTGAITIASGTAQIPVQAVNGGIDGNVGAGTINLIVTNISGLTSVTNSNAATGGYDDESDDDYRQRILTEARKNPRSGSKYDYEEWALEVAGVGSAKCIPEWEGVGTGTVKVVILKTDGTPADSTLINTTKAYIDTLAPIGAIVTVEAPTSVTINITANVTLVDGATTTDVTTEFNVKLQELYKEAIADGKLRYTHVGAILTMTTGVIDYNTLRINGATLDVTIAETQYPKTGTVTFTKV